VDFYGNARIRRGRDEVQGGHIRYNTRSEVLEAVGSLAAPGSDGRVRAVIRPKKDPADAARPDAAPPTPQPSQP
jgi:lipopolysaccharide export system protein LptA